MRYPAHVCALLVSVWLAVPAAPAGQTPSAKPGSTMLTVPPNVRLEGAPSIPSSIPDVVAPYGESRRAVLLGWHPTKRELLVQTALGAVRQVHAVAGPGMDRRQLTFFRDGVSGSASYEPGGAYFVFQKDSGGGAETAQLYRYDVATGQPTLLTDGTSRNGIPVWSHRGGLIAFDSTKRNGKDRDLYVMDPRDPGSVRLVAQLEGNWSAEAWSPSDAELVVLESVSNSERHLWRIDVKTGAKTPMTRPGSAGPEVWAAAQYTPDGATVFAVSNRSSETPRIWRGTVAGNTWTPVTRPENAVESFALSPDGHTLAVVFDSPTTSRVELVDAKSAAVKSSPKLPRWQVLGPPRWHPSGSDVAFTMWSLRSFGDVFSVSAATGTVDRWTRSEVGPFNPDALPEPEIVQWKSFDGLAISGVLYRPPARFTGPRPVIINIHGGPSGATARERPRYQGRSAYFLNELGVAIIAPNVRGSYGYGKTFEDADNGGRRDDAVKDIGALLDWIGAQPFLDKSRVLVTGASYGGYLTYAVAERYGDRIRAAHAASGISNFLSYYETTEPSRLTDRRAEYGDERVPEMRTFLTGISPVTNAARLKTPLFIVHGGKDSRVPVGQAEEMYRAAVANGAPAWLLVFQDEGHEMFANQANNNFWFYTWVLFAQKYLLN